MNFISGILSSFIVYLDDNFFVCHSSYLALLYFWSRVYLYFFGLFLTFHSSFASFFTLFIPLLSVLKYFFIFSLPYLLFLPLPLHSLTFKGIQLPKEDSSHAKERRRRGGDRVPLSVGGGGGTQLPPLTRLNFRGIPCK